MALTRKQTDALIFLQIQDEPVLLIDFLCAGHHLKTLVSLVDNGLADWTSTYRIPSNVTPQEYEEARDTTSYVIAI